MPPNPKDELSVALREAEAAIQPSSDLQVALRDVGAQYQAHLRSRILELIGTQSSLQGDLSSLNKRTKEVLPGLKLFEKSDSSELGRILAQTIESFNGLQKDFESLENAVDALDSRAVTRLAPSRPPQIGLSEPSISIVSIDKQGPTPTASHDHGTVTAPAMRGTSSLKSLLNKEYDAYRNE